jgi:hypothetical protein
MLFRTRREERTPERCRGGICRPRGAGPALGRGPRPTGFTLEGSRREDRSEADDPRLRRRSLGGVRSNGAPPRNRQVVRRLLTKQPGVPSCPSTRPASNDDP